MRPPAEMPTTASLRADAHGDQVGRACDLVVLRRLLRDRVRVRPARDDRDDRRRRHAERRARTRRHRPARAGRRFRRRRRAGGRRPASRSPIASIAAASCGAASRTEGATSASSALISSTSSCVGTQIELGIAAGRALGHRAAAPRRRSGLAGERGGDRAPDERRVRRRERAHVPARLERPRPEVVDAGGARGGDGCGQIGNVGGGQAEARNPELRSDAVRARRRRDALGVLAHERLGGLPERLPVRVGRQHVESRERRDRSPSRRAPAAGSTVLRPPRAATCATSSPRKPVSEVSAPPQTLAVAGRHEPVRLVPEDEIDARLEHGVGPAAAELAVGGLVRAGRRQARPVGRHLARLGMVERRTGSRPRRRTCRRAPTGSPAPRARRDATASTTRPIVSR